MRTGVIYRFGQPGDFDTINAISNEVLGMDIGGTREEFASDMLNWKVRRQSVTVAENSQGIIGYAVLGRYEARDGWDRYSRTMILKQLAVRPTHQDLGVGSTLLSSASLAARGFDAVLLLAGVSSSNALFYAKQGWNVGERDQGLAVIEEEGEYNRQAIPSYDILSRLEKASMIRGISSPPAGQGFDRYAYTVLDSGSIVKVFHVPETSWNPTGSPGKGLVEAIVNNHSILTSMPLSIVLTVMADVSQKLGRPSAEELIRIWIQENPVAAAETPIRLGVPHATTEQIFAHLFRQR